MAKVSSSAPYMAGLSFAVLMSLLYVYSRTEQNTAEYSRLLYVYSNYTHDDKTVEYILKELQTILIVAIDESQNSIPLEKFENITTQMGLHKKDTNKTHMNTKDVGPPKTKNHQLDLENTKKHQLDLEDITILLDMTQNSDKKIWSLKLDASSAMLSKTYPKVKVLIAVMNTKDEYLKIATNSKSISFVKVPQGHTTTEIWRALVEKVQTKLTLVGRDVDYLDEDVNLTLLLEHFLKLNATVVGATYRFPNGYWFDGCKQTRVKNYILSYTAGYAESKYSCQRCDHTDGPFLTYNHLLKKYFNKKLPDPSIFYNFFLKLLESKGLKLVYVCPFTMFHKRSIETKISTPALWTNFSKIWVLDTIQLGDGNVVKIPCHLQAEKESFGKVMSDGTTHTPCSICSLRSSLSFTIDAFNAEKIPIILADGSLLGAMKIKGTAPWEWDGDLLYPPSKFTRVKYLLDKFTKAGFDTHIGTGDEERKYKVIRLFKGGWRIDLEGMLDVKGGMYMTNNSMLRSLEVNITKVNVDGVWMPTWHNPGYNIWKYYKPEIYKHSPHNIFFGLDHNAKYEPRKWKPCNKPAPFNHNCINNFPADGNLQILTP